MKQSDLLEKRHLFVELAKKKATGTPEELAEKLEVKERTLYRFLSDLKTSGLKFNYCRIKKTYYLEKT